ncbi:hypothetical protein [Sagittula sp. MA-2]|jgi:hypothetical protein|uniref:hypothetical protein n=1 Tax=Sagittula sp. MA-2 TaxID=3048007 RepID=UPI0024C28528|nr:hypothetical protein [Sagittula sp. MA-2]WHZ34308.1 hypothetical protein QNI11_16920 [Sagittula sp. MA-2]
MEKKAAPSLFGSTRGSLLSVVNTDMLIVWGAPTSGCVQAGLYVLVPADCCADRAQAPHDAKLHEK